MHESRVIKNHRLFHELVLFEIMVGIWAIEKKASQSICKH